MKKFVFSAVAMMAFSVSSMANTVIVEDQLDSKLIEVELVSDTPCADGAMEVYNLLRDMGLTHNEAWRLSDIAFKKCMKRTYPSLTMD